MNKVDKIKKDTFLLCEEEEEHDGEITTQLCVCLSDAAPDLQGDEFDVFNITLNIQEKYCTKWFKKYPDKWEIVS